jgi:hypothetical protein
MAERPQTGHPTRNAHPDIVLSIWIALLVVGMRLSRSTSRAPMLYRFVYLDRAAAQSGQLAKQAARERAAEPLERE